MEKVMLAIDQSTTGTKAVIMDKAGRVLGREYLVHQQYYPQEGWVEQDGEEIFELTCKAIDAAIQTSHIKQEQIAALAISVQTGAFLVWDKSGKALTHIIGWQCNRGESVVRQLNNNQLASIRDKSGTDASAFLPAAKLKYLLDNQPGLRQAAEKGEALFGSIESWLIYKFTGGKTFASDYCNASITQLLNVKQLCWDDELLEIFTVPKIMMPKLCNADYNYGTVDVPGLPAVPITGVLGDSAAALFAQCGFTPGDVKITYGTGSSVLVNLGGNKDAMAEGMTTSVGWRMNGDQTTYVWEGTAVCTGGVISWLVDSAEMLDDARSSEKIANQVSDADGVYFVPAFSGLGTPYRDPRARACITGMHTATKKAHIVRAALDCIAYQIRDMLEAIQYASGTKVPLILVDGGPTSNGLLMQFQADIINTPILRTEVEESSLLGVCYVAGLATGMYQNKEELLALRRPQREFTPAMDEKKREELYCGWQRAVRQSRLL